MYYLLSITNYVFVRFMPACLSVWGCHGLQAITKLYTCILTSMFHRLCMLKIWPWFYVKLCATNSCDMFILWKSANLGNTVSVFVSLASWYWYSKRGARERLYVLLSPGVWYEDARERLVVNLSPRIPWKVPLESLSVSSIVLWRGPCRWSLSPGM